MSSGAAVTRLLKCDGSIRRQWMKLKELLPSRQGFSKSAWASERSSVRLK